MDILDQNIAEAKKVKQDKDVKSRDGTQPKKYFDKKGDDKLAKSTKQDRARHFEKGAKMSDDNPDAYKPAPGDAKAETKPSKHTKKFKKMFGEKNQDECWDGYKQVGMKKKGDKMVPDCVPEELEIEEGSAADKSLQKKADKSGISKSILKQVYNRGVAAWRTGHRPGTTPEQWGHARVNSFITKGKGTWGKADKDLADKVRGASEEVVKEDNVAVRTALAKAKQVDQMEKLKLQHQKEIEALQAEHERENEGLAQQKEKEVQNMAIQKQREAERKAAEKSNTSESVEEGKLVANTMDIIDVVMKKITKSVEKEMQKSREKGIAMLNDLGKRVGHKVTDKKQEKGKLFLKFGEEMMPGKGNVSDDGVCEFGKDETRKRYQADTPGQSTEDYIKETEKAFHEQKQKAKKNFRDVFQNPLKGFPYNEEIEVKPINEALSKISRDKKLKKSDIRHVEDHLMKSYLSKKVKDKIAFDDDSIYLKGSGRTIMKSKDYVNKLYIDDVIRELEKKVK